MRRLPTATLGPLLWFVGLAVPWLANGNWLSILSLFAIYAVVALSTDIVLGRAGLYDMGHAMYFGVGAYTTAILNTEYGVPVLWTLPLAVLVAAGVGALLAAPIVKLRGDYLLVVTIGFNEIFRLSMDNNVGGLTGGPDGIFGVGVPSLFGHDFSSQSDLYLLNWVVLGVALLLMRNLERSRVGRVFRYLKEDELAATTLGVNARAYKILAFALGAGLAGAAGMLFAVQLSTVSSGAFNFIESVTLFAIVIVGGQASIPGVLLGTVLMFVIPQVFQGLAQYRYFIFGIAMIVVMVLRPQGIWPRRRESAGE
ncbi:branched-chain amino acid ABC transporter permease [Acidihalobacter yilgarnensis]|uniref:Branched-chain amino acid ABC transporter permease n=1 Tax=Acidihalobacter yilgarnensis TaxID=2819280 RepID=A0A1D8INY0_9GAMM|nr:branched-chain amino acid ABC transporter permease [Acidihalobacter yilgarnensis]AOU98114.1 branched-chain amino acid ABC transporter permease [Acidihalobacter yilgarnensis]